MKWKSTALAPVFIRAGVTALMCMLEILSGTPQGFGFFRRIEWITCN